MPLMQVCPSRVPLGLARFCFYRKCLCPGICPHTMVSGVPRNFIRGGGFNKFSWGQRERGSGGSGPLVRGSGGSCNLVQQISHSKIFLIFGTLSKFRNFGGGGGFNPPNPTLGTPLTMVDNNILWMDETKSCMHYFKSFDKCLNWQYT
jgi:hypothetical protein